MRSAAAERALRAGAAPSRILARIRFDEVAVLQAAPLLGAAFACARLRTVRPLPLVLFAFASVCLVAHVFVLNDWSDLSIARGEAGASRPAGDERALRELRALCLGLLFVSLALFAALGVLPLAIALAVAALSALYSAPAVHAKGVPVLGSALHLLGGTLHFLLGYSLSGNVDGRGFAIAAYCAIVFTAGHLVQEVRDHEDDRRDRFRTNAVAFGKGSAFVASMIAFGSANALLVALALRGVLPAAVAIAAAALWPVHLVWSVGALRAGLPAGRVRALQWKYRALYGFLGALLVADLLR